MEGFQKHWRALYGSTRLSDTIVLLATPDGAAAARAAQEATAASASSAPTAAPAKAAKGSRGRSAAARPAAAPPAPAAPAAAAVPAKAAGGRRGRSAGLGLGGAAAAAPVAAAPPAAAAAPSPAAAPAVADSVLVHGRPIAAHSLVLCMSGVWMAELMSDTIWLAGGMKVRADVARAAPLAWAAPPPRCPGSFDA
jgi:hypothetical protein